MRLLALWASLQAAAQDPPAAPTPQPATPTPQPAAPTSQPAPPPPAQVQPGDPPPAVVEPAQDPQATLEATLAAQQAELAAQQARLAEQEARLAEQQAALDGLQDQLTETKVKLLPSDDVTVTFEGHYRVRGSWFEHLYLAQGEGQGYRAARILDQRLWLRPRFAYRDVAKLWVELRALEDVVFGDNASLASTALFTGDPSNTDLTGQEVPSVTVGRVWTEFEVPVGLMRVGRMPSEWGMGLLVAPGDGFDQPFGEARYPTTNDRILFATRPIAIFDAITGREDREIPLFLAVAFDRLVEDPLFQYYGYSCTPGVAQADDRYDPRCDSDGDGITDQDHSYQDEEVTAGSRPLDWWVDSDDDVTQMVYVLAYRGAEVDYLGDTGPLNVGVWAVHRTQRETDSDVWIVDGYLESLIHRVHLETEWIVIDGTTRALPLPDSSQRDPLQKDANILGYAAKAGYVHGPIDAQVETGFASGDDNVADGEFTGRSLHPDHNVGLLLYEQVLAQVTAAVRTPSARGLWSNGGVYSSRYVNPVAQVEVRPGTKLVGGFLVAWPDRPDGAVIRCKSSDPVGCDTPAALQPDADALGWEVDLALKHIAWSSPSGLRSGQEHLLFSLEAGYARITDRLPLENAGLDPDGKYLTVQSRVAWQF